MYRDTVVIKINSEQKLHGVIFEYSLCTAVNEFHLQQILEVYFDGLCLILFLNYCGSSPAVSCVYPPQGTCRAKS